MEASGITIANHFYEHDNCSGLFIYSVDNGKPSYIKFSASITINVIFDDREECTNQNVKDNKLDFPISDLTFSRKGKLDHEETNNKRIKISDGPTGNMCKDSKVISSKVEDTLSIQDSIECQKGEVGCVDSGNPIKDIPHNNDNEDSQECEISERIGKSSTSKYNFRQNDRDEINTHKSLSGQEEGGVNISVKSKPVSISAKQKGFRKKRKGENKSIEVDKTENKSDVVCEIKRTKSKQLKVADDTKVKRRRKCKSKQFDTKVESESVNNIDNSSKNIDIETLCRRKQQRPKKLLVANNVDCIYCGVTFETKLDFYNHRRSKGASFRCKICGKVEPFEAHLMVHMLSHQPDKGCADIDTVKKENVRRNRYKIKCNVCGLVASSIDSLKVHMILHTKESPYRCCVCEDQTFFSLSSLRHHQETHTSSKRFQCKNCELRFESRKELSEHKRNHEIQCGLCSELFPNKTSRAAHYRMSHQNDIKRCTECSKLFSTDEELERHTLYHRKEKKEQCPECGIVVTKLKDHMRIHSRKDEENLFKCDKCPMKYKWKATLIKHLLVHTGERPYACNVCPKRFRSHGMLRKHLLTHTLERPFGCKLCSKRFSVRSNLVTHMRIHSENRKYPCQQCFQAFNYKSSLDIHMKCKHSTSDTPNHLTCVHCPQKFPDESALTAHIYGVHTEKMKTITEMAEWQQSSYTQEEQFSHEADQQLPNTQEKSVTNTEQILPHRQEQSLLCKQDQQLQNVQKQPFSNRPEQHFTNKQGSPFSNVKEQVLSNRQEQPFTSRQESSYSNRQEYPFSNIQEEPFTTRQEHPSSDRREQHLPQRLDKSPILTTGQEPTYITPDPPMMPFLYPDQSHPYQTNNTNLINPHSSIQNSSVHSILNLDRAAALDSTGNFSIPSSNIHIGNNSLPSSNLDPYEKSEVMPYIGHDRTPPINHQGSIISSILSVPPAFHFIPPGLEQLPNSLNFSNASSTSSNQKPASTSNEVDKYDDHNM